MTYHLLFLQHRSTEQLVEPMAKRYINLLQLSMDTINFYKFSENVTPAPEKNPIRRFNDNLAHQEIITRLFFAFLGKNLLIRDFRFDQYLPIIYPHLKVNDQTFLFGRHDAIMSCKKS